MKNSFYSSFSVFVFIAAALLFASCEKETTEEINANIYGKWIIDGLSFDMTFNGASYFDYLVDLGVPEEDAQMMVDIYASAFTMEGSIEFREDGTYECEYLGYQAFEGTWHLSNGNKTLTTDAGTANELEYNVVKLTETNLVVEAVQKSTMDLDGDFSPDDVEMIVQTSYVKE